MHRSKCHSTASNGQAKGPKSRNSEVRKEQNRIASRAYREKRKQRLALLDEILKSDSQTDSMSSVSDETQGISTPHSVSRCRDLAKSPAPKASSLPTKPQWPAVAQSFRQEPYENHWMKYSDRNSDMFATPHNYLPPTPSHYIPSVAPTPSATSTPVFSFDPGITTPHLISYQIYPTYFQEPQSLSRYDGSEVQSSEEDMMSAVESLSRLNSSQQQQVMAAVQRRRRLSHSERDNHSLEFHPANYRVSAPATASSTSPGKFMLGAVATLCQRLTRLTRLSEVSRE
ncbi:hypothetical protein F5Y15DRAFT_18678 [Xylariaceae sp. FL0016]|nr:hypothetical protein F5Y15DRAFT_18678 [Xylariaceae sp. FL0016]